MLKENFDRESASHFFFWRTTELESRSGEDRGETDWDWTSHADAGCGKKGGSVGGRLVGDDCTVYLTYVQRMEVAGTWL